MYKTLLEVIVVREPQEGSRRSTPVDSEVCHHIRDVRLNGRRVIDAERRGGRSGLL